MTTDEEGIDHFHGHPSVSEEIAGNVLHRLKFDNDTIYMVKKLVKYHDQYIEPQPKNVRCAIRKMGEDVFPLLLEVKEADVQAQSDFLREKKEKNLKDVRDVYQRILEEKQCVSLKTLAINGKDLIDQTGMKPGKELGEVLNELLDLVTEDPARNTREYLLKAAKERLKR